MKDHHHHLLHLMIIILKVVVPHIKKIIIQKGIHQKEILIQVVVEIMEVIIVQVVEIIMIDMNHHQDVHQIIKRIREVLVIEENIHLIDTVHQNQIIEVLQENKYFIKK